MIVAARKEHGERSLGLDCLRRVLSNPPTPVLTELYLVAAYCSATVFNSDPSKFSTAVSSARQVFRVYHSIKSVTSDDVVPSLEQRFLSILLHPGNACFEAWSTLFAYLEAHVCLHGGDTYRAFELYEKVLEKRQFCGKLAALPSRERDLWYEYACVVFLSGRLDALDGGAEEFFANDRDVFSSFFACLVDFVVSRDSKPLEKVGKRLLKTVFDEACENGGGLVASALAIIVKAITTRANSTGTGLSKTSAAFLRHALQLSPRNATCLSIVARFCQGEGSDFRLTDDDDLDHLLSGPTGGDCDFCRLTAVPFVFLSASGRVKLSRFSNFPRLLERVARNVDFEAII